MKWSELEPEFTTAMELVDDVLNRTQRVCELFEEMMKAVEVLNQTDPIFIEQTAMQVKVLEKLNLIDDRNDVPVEVMLKAAQTCLRAQYIIGVLVRMNQFVAGLQAEQNIQKFATGAPPTETLH